MKSFDADATMEWLELGDRLATVNPRRYAKLVKMIEQIVESQELLAAVPAPLRTIKSLRRRRYCA